MNTRHAFAEVETIRSRLNTLFYKMEEAEPPPNYETTDAWKRFTRAKVLIDRASTDLLRAMDQLREDAKPCK
jgi:hypothetical protein